MLYVSPVELHLLPRRNLRFDRTGFSEEWQRSQEVMRTFFDSVIAVDLDGTIYDEKGDTLRPGVIDVFKDMREAGNELYVWSARTRHIANPIIASFGLLELVDGVHDKPPMFNRTVEAVADTLGFVPDITIDNEVEERITGGNVGFLLVPSYYPHPNNPEL